MKMCHNLRAILVLPFLTITFYAGKGLARTQLSSHNEVKTTSQIEANRLWKKYLTCSLEVKAEEACFLDVVAKSLNKAEQNKMFEFLTLGFEVSLLYECTKEERGEFSDNYRKNDLLCFKLYGSRSAITGYCFFDRKNSELKISKIKY